MFLLVAGSAQSRGRSDEPIRTQRDRSRSRDQETRRSKRRSAKESDSSNNFVPIVVGPLTTNQDLTNIKGEKIYNLPLMIQQPFLREKKEPIKVDISVKLVPKPRKKEKKKRGAHVEEIVVQADDNRGVKNSFSMEVSDGDIQVLNETVEIIEDKTSATEEVEAKDSHSVEENAPVQEIQQDLNAEQPMSTDQNNEELSEVSQEPKVEQPQGSSEAQEEIVTDTVNAEVETAKEIETSQELEKDEEAI